MRRRSLFDQRRQAVPGCPLGIDSIAGRLWAATAVLVLLWGVGGLGVSAGRAAEMSFGPSLSAADLFALQQRCGAADPVEESYELALQHAFGGPEFKTKGVLAFEENRDFIYAVAGGSELDGDAAEGARAKGPPRLLRRFILLKPATMVVFDLARGPGWGQAVRWFPAGDDAPKIEGRRFRIPGQKGELLWEGLLPKEVTLKAIRREDGGARPADSATGVDPPENLQALRYLHVIHARDIGDESSEARAELVERGRRLELTVTVGDHAYRLWLGSGRPGADEIELRGAEGKTVLARRLLPAGVLPHGPEGAKLLERWDSAYRDDRRPAWDMGRPSSELKKAVEDGTLKPCRVLELGCGTGTNAVYLAGKGFEVTAVDIAPTALMRAREKARRAGVRVRFLLADVLAPPELRPFELIYDRGCYHGVRRQNAAGYVETVGRLTRPGGRLLILAGNANEAGGGGPPRVKEEEIRGDFSESFEFEWLRETRFDTTDADAKGALAWSVLVRRK